MEAVSRKASPARKWIAPIVILLVASVLWFWRAGSPAAKHKENAPVQVMSAAVVQTDVAAKLTTNGTVTAVQTVEVRPQISATIKSVHIKEGQSVRKGDRLFTLDARTENANLDKAEAQIVKDRADLLNAERNLERQRELFRQEYISRAELDAAQNQVNVLRGQVAIDQASLEGSRVARSFGEITAPITGRTGAIAIYPGSLVQPGGAALVNITQVDPIHVSFTLPERELADVQQAMVRGEVPVTAKPDVPGQPGLEGRLVFIDNAVDTASGTIRLKAEFPNPDNRLWPGMFVTVTLAPRTLAGALTVPVQAVQTGPEHQFVYVIGDGRKVSSQPVTVRLIQDGVAVIEGVAPGTRVVVEGAHNLRPGDAVSEDGGRRTEDRQSGPQPNSAGKQ